MPLHGYYFRILSKSGGGLSAIAYPAMYGASGVMTFIVNQDDVVYEKDLRTPHGQGRTRDDTVACGFDLGTG
jgi:hypothetical protein